MMNSNFSCSELTIGVLIHPHYPPSPHPYFFSITHLSRGLQHFLSHYAWPCVFFGLTPCSVMSSLSHWSVNIYSPFSQRDWLSSSVNAWRNKLQCYLRNSGVTAQTFFYRSLLVNYAAKSRNKNGHVKMDKNWAMVGWGKDSIHGKSQ